MYACILFFRQKPAVCLMWVRHCVRVRGQLMFRFFSKTYQTLPPMVRNSLASDCIDSVLCETRRYAVNNQDVAILESPFLTWQSPFYPLSGLRPCFLELWLLVCPSFGWLGMDVGEYWCNKGWKRQSSRQNVCRIADSSATNQTSSGLTVKPGLRDVNRMASAWAVKRPLKSRQ